MIGNNRNNRNGEFAERGRIARRLLAAVIYIMLAAAAYWYFKTHREDFSRMLSLKPAHLVGLLALNFISRIFLGARMKYLIEPFGTGLSLAEGTGVSLMQGYGNTVAVKGGTVGIAYYLYRTKGLGIDRFLAVTGGGFVITAATLSVFGLVGYGLISMGGRYAGPAIPLIFSIILAGGIGALLFPKLHVKTGKTGRFLLRVMEGWNVIKSNRSNILKLVAVEFMVLVTFAARYWVAFDAFGQPIGLIGGFLLAPPAYLTTMVSVTPVGVGIREPLLAYMSGILGYAVTGGLGAAVLDSLALMAVSLVGGPVAALALVGRYDKQNGSERRRKAG